MIKIWRYFAFKNIKNPLKKQRKYFMIPLIKTLNIPTHLDNETEKKED